MARTRFGATAQQKQRSWLGETFRTLLIAILIALGFRTFFYEPFTIPTGSMIPTLEVGDYVFVSKFSYGYSRYTLTFGFDLFDGRILGGRPERGDVAVFRLPSDTSTNYIKRVIGLPGDEIQVQGGRLFINGEMAERELVEERQGPGGRTTYVYEETLPNGVTHILYEDGDGLSMDNTPVYEVPEGHYFMMGDNRDHSADSRYLSQVGYVPEENLVGRAEFIWFSLEDASFWQVWRWPTALRWGRLLDGVE